MNLMTYNENNFLNETQKNKRDFFKQHRSRLIGEATALGIVQIIEYFKPKIWIIENPKTSKIWEYITNLANFKGIENDTYYNNYDNINFTKKPTKFLSNINLELKNNSKTTSEKKWEHFNTGQGYDISSSIPKKLLEHIMKIIGITNEL